MWLNLIRADALSAGRDACAPRSVALFEGSVILTNVTQGSLTLTLGYTLSPLMGLSDCACYTRNEKVLKVGSLGSLGRENDV